MNLYERFMRDVYDDAYMVGWREGALIGALLGLILANAGWWVILTFAI